MFRGNQVVEETTLLNKIQKNNIREQEVQQELEKYNNYIQVLLVDKLDQYKGKIVVVIDEHMETLQEAYTNLILYSHYYLNQINHQLLDQFSYKKKLITWRKC